MPLSFAHLWQQQEGSDMDVVLMAPAPAEASDQQQQLADATRPAALQLVSFPAHSTLLSNSAVLWCRVLRWQEEDPCTRAPKRVRRSSSTNTSTEQTTRARLELELHDASDQQAALAVLQSLYAVKPLPELLSELSHEQQLQAAVLADKWQVPDVSSAAAQMLIAAANTPGALAEEVQHSVLAAAALPDCLQPLQQRVLLSMLEDLEAVWADSILRDKLLGLPLHAMELLLSCNELKIASEDTVLYTAQQYLVRFTGDQRAHAQRQLAPLIRCPHLSWYCLVASVNSAAADTMLLAELRPHLRRLLMLAEVRPSYVVAAADLQEGGLLAGAPPGWGLGRRVSKPVTSVQLVWRLDVRELRDTACRCATEQDRMTVNSPEATPPLGGTAFRIKNVLGYQDGGVKVGMYGFPANLPDDVIYACKYRIQVQDFDRGTTPRPKLGSVMSGWSEYFQLGPMAGGWDEAAWVAKGLPASGQLTIKLTVSDVPHAMVPLVHRIGQR